MVALLYHFGRIRMVLLYKNTLFDTKTMEQFSSATPSQVAQTIGSSDHIYIVVFFYEYKYTHTQLQCQISTAYYIVTIYQ